MDKVAKKPQTRTLTSSQFLRAVMGLKRTSGNSTWVCLEYTSQTVEINLQHDDGETSIEVWLGDKPAELTEKQLGVLRARIEREVDAVAEEIRMENYTEQFERPYHPYNNAFNHVAR